MQSGESNCLPPVPALGSTTVQCEEPPEIPQATEAGNLPDVQTTGSPNSRSQHDVKRKGSVKSSKQPDMQRTDSPDLQTGPRRLSKGGIEGQRRLSAKRPSEAMVMSATSTIATRNIRWAKLFAKLDLSGDAMLDKEEFFKALSSWTDSCPRIQSNELDDFSVWDCDGSGFLSEGEFFCFCDALWQILGEREFSVLEEKVKEHADYKKTASGSSLEITEESLRRLSREPTTDNMVKQATRQLRQAMQDVDNDGRKALRKAINEARHAGVDRQLIDEAVILVRKVEVEGVLQRAMESKQPKLLKAALLNASKLNASKIACNPDLVQKAEELLATIEAQETMDAAIATKDPFIVEAAIAKARRSSVSFVEIQKAQAEHDRLEKIEQTARGVAEAAAKSKDREMQALAKSAALRSELDAILVKKEVVYLDKFIERMETDHLQDPDYDSIMDKARQARSGIQAATQARRELTKCMMATSQANLKELQDAIDTAKACGLPEEETGRATLVLKKEQAREALHGAIATEKRSKLQKAIETATELGLKMPEIDTAKMVLKKLDVSRDISLVLSKQDGNYDIQMLRKLVAEAKSLEVDGGKVAKVEELIAKLPPDLLECDEEDGLI